jgi:hypothetical protein
MAWQQPKTNWDTHPKAIEPADMNRIEGNILAVREQNNMALRLEVVDSFPSHAPGRAIYHTGNKMAYVSDGSNWMPFASPQLTKTYLPNKEDQVIEEGYHKGSIIKGFGPVVAGCEKCIYNRGKQYTPPLVQGIAYAEQSTASLRLDFESDHIYMYVRTGRSDIAAVTDEKIDMTYFKEVIIDWKGERDESAAYMYGRVVLSDNKMGGYNDGIILGSKYGDFSRTVDRYNIEEITGEYYLRVHRCYDLSTTSTRWSRSYIYAVSLGL